MKEFFDKDTEAKLLKLGRKKYAKTLILTILWILLVLAAWIFYMVKMNRAWNTPSAFAYPLLCLLPFFPFRVHKTLFSKTFYGTVESARFSVVHKAVSGPITYSQAKELEIVTADVVFRGDKGEKRSAAYREASVLAHDLYYKKDDRVLVIRGLKYPVKYPIPEAEEYLCPVCGNFIKPGKRTCRWCKADFS